MFFYTCYENESVKQLGQVVIRTGQGLLLLCTGGKGHLVLDSWSMLSAAQGIWPWDRERTFSSSYKVPGTVLFDSIDG